jgi:ABC-type amino acid transport substrate-binding protein
MVCRRTTRIGDSFGSGATYGEILMIRMISALAAALLLMAAPAQAQQASRLDGIVKRGTLRVGLTGDYLPFSSLDKETSKFSGFDVDMAEQLGVRIEYVHTAWPQLTRDFEADNFDIAMGGISITLDRQKRGMFSTPIMRADRALRRPGQVPDTGRYRPARHPRDRQSGRHQRTLCQGQYQQRRHQDLR